MKMRMLYVAAMLALVAATGLPVAGQALEVSYGSHPLQIVDLYVPQGKPGGIVLELHGGGWAVGDKRLGSVFLDTLRETLRSEYVVINANYRLAPADPFPAAAGDVQSLLAWARERWPGGGVVVVGESAGGTLAATTLQTGGVEGVVALGGYYDLLTPSVTAATNDRIRTYLGCEPTACESRAMAASPYWTVASAVPLLIVHGTEDVLAPASQAVRMAEAYPDQATLMLMRGLPHSGPPFVIPEVMDPVQAFIRARLRPGGVPAKPGADSSY